MDAPDGSVSYSIDSMTAVVSIFRIYLIFPMIEIISSWTSSRARRLAKMNGVKANSIFAMKSYSRMSPYKSLIFLIVLSIIILALILRIFENIGGKVLNYVYLVTITMTTIGYGDISPDTHFGRTIAIVGCVWGVFLISLFTNALMNAIEFVDNQELAYDEITKRRALSKHAKSIVKLYLRLHLMRKTKRAKMPRAKILMKLITRVIRFSRLRQAYSRDYFKLDKDHIDNTIREITKSSEILDQTKHWSQELTENFSDLNKKVKAS